MVKTANLFLHCNVPPRQIFLVITHQRLMQIQNLLQFVPHCLTMNLLDTRASSKLLSKEVDAICPTEVVPCSRVRLYGMEKYDVQ